MRTCRVQSKAGARRSQPLLGIMMVGQAESKCCLKALAAPLPPASHCAAAAAVCATESIVHFHLWKRSCHCL